MGSWILFISNYSSNCLKNLKTLFLLVSNYISWFIPWFIYKVIHGNWDISFIKKLLVNSFTIILWKYIVMEVKQV